MSPQQKDLYTELPAGTVCRDYHFKKISDVIPGFRGYSTLDDMKAADSQIRDQVLKELKRLLDIAVPVKDHIQGLMFLSLMADYEAVITGIKAAISEVEAAYPGYGRICDTYKPLKDSLEEIYRVDYTLLNELENAGKMLHGARIIRQEHILKGDLYKVKSSVEEFSRLYALRNNTILCLIEKK